MRALTFVLTVAACVAWILAVAAGIRRLADWCRAWHARRAAQAVDEVTAFEFAEIAARLGDINRSGDRLAKIYLPPNVERDR